MASGPLAGEAGGDGAREKQRWQESKVYTRKAHRKGSKKTSQPLSSRSLGPEDGNNSSQQQVSARLDAPSDDTSSLNHRQQVAVPESREAPADNGLVSLDDNRVRYNLSSRSKKDLRELRRKLVNELDQVRNLVKKLEAKEMEVNGYSSQLRVCANEAVENSGLKRVNSQVASAGHREPRALPQLSVPVVENRQGGAGDLVEKEKRTPKANQYYHNSGFIVGNEKLPPPESNKKAKVNGVKKHGGGGGEVGFGFRINKHLNQVFNSCSALLARLMKHKHGWVFTTPVDAKGLGLYDYHLIIKHPMDLGTVKSRLNSGWYNSPREFAEDVRLTFHNAMTYNPKGQDVHVMAEMLLKIFEDRWAVIESEYNLDFRFEEDRYRVNLLTSIPNKTSAPSLPSEMRNNPDRSESVALPVELNSKISNYAPLGRTPALKKPKAKDPNKRNMTYEEKQRLSTNLQILPSEKLDNIVQIIKKRTTSLSQHDDEIEVDIDSVDPETLWELDRFVTNYKKSLSKKKRKAEMALKAREAAKKNSQGMSPDAAMVNTTMQTKTDEKHMPFSSPVLAEKQGDYESRSSSSSSSSSDSGSSSSDSDSESSSGSDAGHSSRT